MQNIWWDERICYGKKWNGAGKGRGERKLFKWEAKLIGTHLNTESSYSMFNIIENKRKGGWRTVIIDYIKVDTLTRELKGTRGRFRSGGVWSVWHVTSQEIMN